MEQIYPFTGKTERLEKIHGTKVLKTLSIRPQSNTSQRQLRQRKQDESHECPSLLCREGFQAMMQGREAI